MAKVDWITLTTGFLIPENNEGYKPVETEEDLYSSIIQRTVVGIDEKRIEHFKKHQVCSSEKINTIYSNHLETRSPESYFELIDIVQNIFKEVTLTQFLLNQAYNPQLTNISFQFCVDLVKLLSKQKSVDTLKQYSVIPYNIRYSFTTIPKYELEKRYSALREAIDSSSKWYNQNIKADIDSFIIELAKDRNTFLSFFKFVLVDTY